MRGRGPSAGADAPRTGAYAALIARSAGGRVSAHVDGERVEFVALVKPPEGMIG